MTKAIGMDRIKNSSSCVDEDLANNVKHLVDVAVCLRKHLMGVDNSCAVFLKQLPDAVHLIKVMP